MGIRHWVFIAGGTGSSVAASTWNPLDKGPNVILSGGNLTASKAAAGYEVVRSTISKNSGHRYFEITVGVGISGVVLGIADAGMVLTGRYLGENHATSKKSAGHYGPSPGTFYRNMTNAASFSSYGAYAVGAKIGFDIDFATFTIKVYNGDTGALKGTYVDAAPWPALFPAAAVGGGGTATLNQDGPFTFLPSGSVAWTSP